ncbi:WG containing repeat-containing protein [Hymenobacter daecheongensis DSM 21074]|uniref:WG containing repeat-containing protein n=1 Tax=Hymenobacter daecheongensis DSM 21074 TaxID=1121955 RepID=A0A1M6ALE1_9BACT|nr:WG repeat-containing protein [Hymenobacter daecheongensis]SHI37023.1 WG containing repeat-containing protein [Hymenobacter daecheongensis DSM 21074]
MPPFFPLRLLFFRRPRRLLLAGGLLLLLGAAQITTARLVPFRRGAKWGYADPSRRLVLPLLYDEAGPFVGEVAWIRQGTLYGYIDGAGNPITPVQFTKAGNFHRGRATVELNGETYDLDTSGNRLTTPADPEPESDFLTHGDVTHKDGKVGFRFTVGQTVVPPIYDEIRENYNGLLFVRQGPKWGVLNDKGKPVLPLAFDAIRATEANGFALPVVEQQGRFGYLADDGRLLVPPKYQAAEPFVEGVARVTTPDGLSGYVDTRGREFFEP